MGAQGNEQWQELEQGVIVISDGESANEGPQPKRQKTAIAPPYGGSTEEDAKAEEQWQEDAKAEFLSVLSLFSQEPPQTGAGSQPTDGGLRRHVVWVYWDVCPGEWESALVMYGPQDHDESQDVGWWRVHVLDRLSANSLSWLHPGVLAKISGEIEVCGDGQKLSWSPGEAVKSFERGHSR